MQISYQTLLEHFTQSVSVDDIHQALNQMGSEVEKISNEDDDTIFHLEITPNRPDLLCYHGLAREISAGLQQPKLQKPLQAASYEADSDVGITVDLHAPSDCPQYYLRKIINITPQPSPDEWQKSLTHSGFSVFNHIVDIINLKMAQFGQPMHAIDADKIVGNIVIRHAKPNETILCLDGKTRTLCEKDVLISDEADNPVAIAGVIGAKFAEVTKETKNILLECAYFDPQTVRKTCKRLNIMTESSKRFEMGVDPEGLLHGLNTVTDALLNINGQLVGTAVHQNYSAEDKSVTLSLERLQLYFSLLPEHSWIENSMRSLGFEIEAFSGTQITVKVPSWRQRDVKYDVCLIEELAKIYDYNKLPSFPPQAKISLRPKNRWLQFKRRSEDFFVHQGFYQVVNFGFMSEEDLHGFGSQKTKSELEPVFIERPLNKNFTILRPTQLPGLIKNFNANIDRAEEQIQLFEIGRTFYKTQQGTIQEQRSISGVMYGPHRLHDWQQPTHINSFYDIKALIHAYLVTTTRHPAQAFRYQPTALDFYVEGRGSDIYYNDQQLGHMGQIIHQDIHKKSSHPVLGFELNLDQLIRVGNHDTTQYVAPSRFPSIHKDFAFIVDQGFASQHIVNTIREIGQDLVKAIYLFDVYQGKPIPKGKESLAYKIEFNASDRSLTHDEVNGLFEEMIKTLTKTHGLQLRDA